MPQHDDDDRASQNRNETDRQLVERVQLGDKTAFDLLVVRYQNRVAGIVGRYVRDYQDIRDLTQETFIKAYRAIDRFRGDSAFYTWLYRIAVNAAKNFIEARNRRPHTVMEATDAEQLDVAPTLRDDSAPEHYLQRDQLQQVLRQAIADLPEDLRSALLLRELEGLSYEDIAIVLSCPIGTVRSRIFRARDFLERRMASQGGETVRGASQRSDRTG
ncbi:MAG: RNA polymerase sigma factor RpoE [Halomonadaceae bacterium]|nr:MAG: RNA polymerase sigma factor RpoE [Halomonadaceae bacterium]